MKKFSLPNPNLGLEITCKSHTIKFSKPGIRMRQIRTVEIDCSKSDYPIPKNSPNQAFEWDRFEHSRSTVPNQTTPYHTILQTAVSRGTRPLSLPKKRLKVGLPELCPKMRSLCPDRLWKKANFQVVMLNCDKALSSKYVYSLEDYKHNLISIIFTKDKRIDSFLKKRRNAKLTNPLESLLW